MTTDPRTAYLDVGLSTASPERLLLLLWDRLLVDLDVADDALGRSDLSTASARLIHAQDIVFELRSTLRSDVWEAAGRLAELYRYAEERLVAANVRKDPAILAECRDLLTPLRDAFHAAAGTVITERSLAATA